MRLPSTCGGIGVEPGLVWAKVGTAIEAVSDNITTQSVLIAHTILQRNLTAVLLGTVLKPCASGLSRFSRRVLGLFLHRSAGTHINLSNGLLYYHGVVMFPSPILASPLNHGTQSITGPL